MAAVDRGRTQVHPRPADLSRAGPLDLTRWSTMADLAFITLTVAFFAAVAIVARKLDRS